MKHEMISMSIHRPEAYFVALVEPFYGLADGILYGISALRRKVRKGIESWKRDHAIRVTIAELSCLDDRVLKDIGVDRDNIYAVAVTVVDDPTANVRELAGS